MAITLTARSVNSAFVEHIWFSFLTSFHKFTIALFRFRSYAAEPPSRTGFLSVSFIRLSFKSFSPGHHAK